MILIQAHFPFEKKIEPMFQTLKTEPTATTQSKPSATKLMAIENAEASADTLKLKRNKPLARTTSKLESALGITRKKT